MKISFIGYGNMAKAMIKSLINNKTYQIHASAPSLCAGIDQNGVKTCSDNLALVHDADIVILAVKPAHMHHALEQINSTSIPSHCIVISVASGLSLNWFEKYFPTTAVVRAMPNIASALGKGATPLAANHLVTKEHKEKIEQIFSKFGLFTWVKNESEINAFTALSGSGPAYIFMFMEAMIKAAIGLGLTEDIAKDFVVQTFNGAVSLAMETPLSPTELRKTVTSPAGTTAAAIEVLNQHNFDAIIEEAMHAACERARQLGENSCPD